MQHLSEPLGLKRRSLGTEIGRQNLDECHIQNMQYIAQRIWPNRGRDSLEASV